MSLNGTGGGRKTRTGSPEDFFEGIHFFKSRRAAVRTLTEWRSSRTATHAVFDARTAADGRVTR